MSDKKRLEVAVVGSGMAGLVTAWLLKQDSRRQYNVEIFESGSEPSLDFASVSVLNVHTGHPERVDVPMRAFTEGYYHNLKAMYDHLGVRYCVQPFLFSFSRLTGQNLGGDGVSDEKQYFVHASNFHRLPPTRPQSIGVVHYLGELLFALICHLWFSICCVLIPAREAQYTRLCESFDEYLLRIRLPRHFVRYYLLPLMSAVTTCPHKVLLEFPAKDVVEYKRCITSGRQLTVSAGVNEVQRKLIKGIKIRNSAQVVSVEPQDRKVKISWRTPDSDEVQHRRFDKVVLAVPPNVVGSIFAPLKKEMQAFPTVPVSTIVHRDQSDGIVELNRPLKNRKQDWCASPDTERAQVIHLRTVAGSEVYTEATHVQPSGVMVTSCPLAKRDPTKIIKSSNFTRVLRTPESRYRVNRIFGPSQQTLASDEKQSRWRNGDGGVYLVGSWCWDGMVLLEGCVVSAIRTASELGVDIPWRQT